MRVSKAMHELDYESKFETVLVNNHLELALAQAENLVNTFLKP